jgi:PAS domain S-box-containing protein
VNVLILSYFDPIVGPRIFLKAPESTNDEDIKVIASMMDVYEEKFYIHITGSIKSANYIFEISNPHSRGEKELLQISIVVDIDSEINLNLARELLEGFVKEFNEIEEVYRAFYFEFEAKTEGKEKLNEVKVLFKTFHKSFKPAVKALELAEIRFQTLFKAARDAILIIDKETADIVDANTMAERLFEKPRKELIGQNASQLMFIEDYKDIRKHVLKLIHTENATPAEIRIKKSDGKGIPVEINANEMKIDERYLSQVIIRDITERKIAEQKIVKAYDRADFFKDLFAYDMNRILGNINKSSELLSSYLNNPKLVNHKDEVLWMIKEQALKGLNLILYVQKILDIEESDISMGKIEINSLLNEAMTNVTNSFIEKLLEINLETIGGGIFVRSNELLLNVFESILINAAQHNDKPFVSLQIKISKEKKKKVNYYRIEFLDNGMGIPDDIKKDVFIKGYRQDESMSGMGLGLYLVNRIVESFNGQIWVEDRIEGDYGKGSKFILLMPAA